MGRGVAWRGVAKQSANDGGAERMRTAHPARLGRADLGPAPTRPDGLSFCMALWHCGTSCEGEAHKPSAGDRLATFQVHVHHE